MPLTSVLIPSYRFTANNFQAQLKELARLLLSFEAVPMKLSHTAHPSSPAAFRVCKKLVEPLSQAMGIGGVRALLSRALVLAGAEVPCLCALQIRRDGSLGGGCRT